MFSKLDAAIPFAEAALACLLLWAGLHLILAWCVVTLIFVAVVVVADRFLPNLSVRTLEQK